MGKDQKGTECWTQRFVMKQNKIKKTAIVQSIKLHNGTNTYYKQLGCFS